MSISLSAAVAAEIVDAVMKHIDSARLQERAASSLRPLLPIRVAVAVTASEELLRDPEYRAFFARLDSEIPHECDFEARIRYGDEWFPKRTETQAWELAAVPFRADLSLQPGRHSSERIAFTAVEPTDEALTTLLKKRRFTFDRGSGLVVAEFSGLISPRDLISDSPRIASFDDLCGAELVVELDSPDSIDLYEVTFQLPDTRRVSVHRSEFAYDAETRTYSYTFPATSEKLYDMTTSFPAFRVTNQSE